MCVKNSNDLYAYCFLYAISALANGIIGTFIAMVKYKLVFVRITFADIVDEIKDGFYIFTVQLSSKIFSAIGITFLILFTSSTEVGIFSAIQKIPMFIILVWMPISQILYPISTKKMKESLCDGVRYVFSVQKKILIIFGSIVLISSILSEYVVSILFGAEYSQYYYWSIPLLLWVLVSINNNCLGIQILLASGHDKQYSQCFQISVLAMIVLNFILTYLWHGNGAAFAPLIAESILGILLYRKVHHLIIDERGL